MLEENLLKYFIEDILIAGAHTVPDIAKQVDTTDDVIVDIVEENNMTPSFTVARKIINLHQTVRPQLYHGFMQKAVKDAFMREIE
ncbi:hypothetical protein AYO45_06340 [Gammaproteobacteria bacterium SCGC AG-212-F23]|nr:hypothetical protein AYO45_06340 [Gammaproteobacteria bacterium SCGC AG-212-F23]